MVVKCEVVPVAEAGTGLNLGDFATEVLFEGAIFPSTI